MRGRKKAIEREGIMRPDNNGGDAMDPEELELDPQDQDDEGSNEPFGAQVTRRLWEDKNRLLQDYDGLMGPLEHEPTRKLLQEVLEHKASMLDKIQGHWGKHYKDLPGLEDFGNGEGGPLEEEEEELDDEQEVLDELGEAQGGNSGELSGGEDEVTGEEAAEGMRTKGRKRMPRRKKAMCGRCAGSKRIEGESEYMKDLDDPDADGGDMGGEGGDDEGLGDEEEDLFELGEDHVGAVGETQGFMHELAQEGSELDDEKRMKAYHYGKTLEGIAQYKQRTGSKAAPTRVGPRGRYATVRPTEPQGDATVPGGRPMPRESGFAEWDVQGAPPENPNWEDIRTHASPEQTDAYFAEQTLRREGLLGGPIPPPESVGMPTAKSVHPHRSALLGAAEHCGLLCREKNFGDAHRKMCAMHAKALGEVLGVGEAPGGEDDEDDVDVHIDIDSHNDGDEDEDTPLWEEPEEGEEEENEGGLAPGATPELGAVQEKGRKNGGGLEALFKSQQAQIASLGKTIEALTKSV